MSQNRAVLTVYRGLLRQARLLSEEERLVVRHPVDPEAFRRTNHSWAKPADGGCSDMQNSIVAATLLLPDADQPP